MKTTVILESLGSFVAETVRESMSVSYTHLEVVEIYRGRIVDLSKNSLIIELTGTSDKLDAFMDMMSCHEISEVCRTGITGIGRGASWHEGVDM